MKYIQQETVLNWKSLEGGHIPCVINSTRRVIEEVEKILALNK